MDKLNLMKNFMALVEEGSFTGAAKRLGKTKALLSTQITRLECSLGVQLVQRSTRSLSITPAGYTYYETGKHILDEVENLEFELTQQGRGLSGRIRISTPITYGEEVLIPLFANLKQQQPQLHIDMVLTDRHIDLVNEGFDLAIRIGQLKDSTLIARKLGDSQMIVCAAPALLQHHNMAVDDVTDPNQLCNLPCIIDSNCPHLNQWQFRRDKNAITVNVQGTATVNNARAGALLALAGTGVIMAPDFIVNTYLERGLLVRLLSHFNLDTMPIHALYPSKKHVPAKVSHFVDALLRHFSQFQGV